MHLIGYESFYNWTQDAAYVQSDFSFGIIGTTAQ